MSLVESFTCQLPGSLLRLAEDEWSVEKLRKQVVREADSRTAFESIVGIVVLASKQTDPYAFASCCWLANELVSMSGTTEEPEGVQEALAEALSTSFHLKASRELSTLWRWYRLPPNHSIERTNSGLRPPLAAHVKR